jgi:hypothetical protein
LVSDSKGVCFDEKLLSSLFQDTYFEIESYSKTVFPVMARSEYFYSHPAGGSPIERLPFELLERILQSVSLPPVSDSVSQMLPGTYFT